MTNSSSELPEFGVSVQAAAVPDGTSLALLAPPASAAPVKTKTFRLVPFGEPDGAVNVTVRGVPPCAVTVNDAVLAPVPAGVVTAIGPVAAPAGTVAVIWVAELTVNVAALPPKVTAVAPVKPLPVLVTDVPTGPEVGVNEETVGAGACPGVGMGSGVAEAPLLGAVPRLKWRYSPASRL